MAKRKATSTGLSAPKPKRNMKHVGSESMADSTIPQPPSLTGAPKQTSFFDLPRELRDQIYHEIWSSKLAFKFVPQEEREVVGYHKRKEQVGQVHYLDRYTEVTPEHNAPRPELTGNTWFLASKQMCAEAIRQFQRGATWTFNGPLPVRDERFPLRWRAPYDRRADADMSPYLLKASEATNIVVKDVAKMKTLAEMDHRENPMKRVIFQDPGILQRLVPTLRGSSSLRSLTIKLEVEKHWDYTDTGAIEIDFKLLEDLNLTNLKQLHFFVVDYSLFSEDERLKHKFYDALDELSVRMMGGIRATKNYLLLFDSRIMCSRKTHISYTRT